MGNKKKGVQYTGLARPGLGLDWTGMGVLDLVLDIFE